MTRIRTLRDLLEREQAGILIPIVQRDYAQGRRGEGEVRDGFLDALHAALKRPVDDPAIPLDLDFVYGSRPEGTGPFLPLDGQQRLTTLLLLHWYTAMQDGEGANFRAYAWRGETPRFSYEVRPSSEDFFAGLLEGELKLHALLPADKDRRGQSLNNALSKTLCDEPWFYASWLHDPTIQSCLTMLDAIHERFAGEQGLYRLLSSRTEPRITFQFLDLDRFGLGDELYIKMNARGKSLTPFEAFKAQLEQHIARTLPDEQRTLDGRRMSLSEYVGHQFDGVWSDLFWDKRAPDELDSKLMNIVRSVALAAMTGDGEDAKTVNRALGQISRDELPSFKAYLRQGFLGPEFVQTLVTLLDRLRDDDGGVRSFLKRTDYYDERETLARVLRGGQTREDRVTYTDWVVYAAWCQYLISDLPVEGLDEWIRVISNLAYNSTIEDEDAFRTALAGVRALLVDAGTRLLEHVADPSRSLPMGAQQGREERIKAQLILRDAGWRPLIEHAETHPYFEGQIEFLFAFCGILDRWIPGESCNWSDQEDERLREEFETWGVRVEALLPRTGTPGLKEPPDRLWQRALLCEGNYLLRKGGRTSLLRDDDRDVSWKRLLQADLKGGSRVKKRDVVRRVLARVEPGDVEGSLRRIVAAGVHGSSSGSAEWRQRLVEFQEVLEYCQNGWMQFERGTVFLLKKRVRWAHRELYTWHLALTLEHRVSAGEFIPFDRLVAAEANGRAEQPTMDLLADGDPELLVRVTFLDGEFRLSLPLWSGPDPWDTAGSVEVRTVTPELIEDELLALAGRLRNFPRTKNRSSR